MQWGGGSSVCLSPPDRWQVGREWSVVADITSLSRAQLQLISQSARPDKTLQPISPPTYYTPGQSAHLMLNPQPISRHQNHPAALFQNTPPHPPPTTSSPLPNTEAAKLDFTDWRPFDSLVFLDFNYYFVQFIKCFQKWSERFEGAGQWRMDV